MSPAAGAGALHAGRVLDGRAHRAARRARRVGDRVERLVLIGASPGIADPGRARGAAPRADERAGRRDRGARAIEEFARRWARDAGARGPAARGVATAAHADRLRNTPAGLARALRGLGTGALPPLWDRLGRAARCRSTLVVGERDAKLPRDRRADGARRCPAGELIVVPGAGHAVHLEAPEVDRSAIGQPASAPEPVMATPVGSRARSGRHRSWPRLARVRSVGLAAGGAAVAGVRSARPARWLPGSSCGDAHDLAPRRHAPPSARRARRHSAPPLLG